VLLAGGGGSTAGAGCALRVSPHMLPQAQVTHGGGGCRLSHSECVWGVLGVLCEASGVVMRPARARGGLLWACARPAPRHKQHTQVTRRRV
jgi:hypothetical protein